MLATVSLSSFADLEIIGGKPVTSTEAPWVVKIHKDNEAWCSGTLISSRWIVTAAHCLDEEKESSAYSVFAGGTGKKKDLIELSPVRQVIPHENYSMLSLTPGLDIGLIELHEDVKFSATIKALPLLGTKDLTAIRDQQPVLITGWGYIDNAQKVPTELTQIQIPLVKTSEIPDLKKLKYFQVYPLWATTNFLVTVNKNVTTCNGDSGTGWVMKYKNVPHLVAVHSAGDRCESIAIGNPVGPHFEWIKENIR